MKYKEHPHLYNKINYHLIHIVFLPLQMDSTQIYNNPMDNIQMDSTQMFSTQMASSRMDFNQIL